MQAQRPKMPFDLNEQMGEREQNLLYKIYVLSHYTASPSTIPSVQGIVTIIYFATQC